MAASAFPCSNRTSKSPCDEKRPPNEAYILGACSSGACDTSPSRQPCQPSEHDKSQCSPLPISVSWSSEGPSLHSDVLEISCSTSPQKPGSTEQGPPLLPSECENMVHCRAADMRPSFLFSAPTQGSSADISPLPCRSPSPSIQLGNNESRDEEGAESTLSGINTTFLEVSLASSAISKEGRASLETTPVHNVNEVIQCTSAETQFKAVASLPPTGSAIEHRWPCNHSTNNQSEPEWDVASCPPAGFRGKRTNLCSLERELARPGDARNLDNTEGISSHSKGLSTNSSDDLSCRTSVEQTVDPSGQLSHLAHSLSCRGVKLLGKFDLDQTVVSYGGDAIVYQGKLLTQGKVAVKVVHFHKNDLSGLKKLLNEIYIWSKLHHENILPLLGVTIEFGDSIAMVSQWMAGGNAHMYVQDQTIDPRTLLVEVAKALRYLHAFSICHGDLKGHNVLISDDGHALLGDFGHSCSYFADLSMSDMVCEPRCGGTLRWMPPERLGYPNRNATTEGDVWAFGMTALELFTRKVPFSETKGESRLVTRILMRRLPDRPSSEATLTRLSDEWWNVCTGCWAEDPSKRLQMSEVIKLLSVGA